MGKPLGIARLSHQHFSDYINDTCYGMGFTSRVTGHGYEYMTYPSSAVPGVGVDHSPKPKGFTTALCGSQRAASPALPIARLRSIEELVSALTLSY